METITFKFEETKILTVYELHVYELFKFAMKSIRKEHVTTEFNQILHVEDERRYTRSSALRLVKQPRFRTNTLKDSVTNRTVKLFNILKSNSLIPDSTAGLSRTAVSNFIHDFRDNFILSNYNLVSSIF